LRIRSLFIFRPDTTFGYISLGGDYELWKKLKGYGRRSLAETFFSRLKTLLGDWLMVFLTRLKKADSGYDATDRSKVMRYLEHQRAQGEVVTGLLYINAELPEMHRIYRTSETPMKDVAFEKLNPGSEALAKLQALMR